MFLVLRNASHEFLPLPQYLLHPLYGFLDVSIQGKDTIVVNLRGSNLLIEVSFIVNNVPSCNCLIFFLSEK